MKICTTCTHYYIDYNSYIIYIIIYIIHSHAPGMLHAKGCLGSRPQRLEKDLLTNLSPRCLGSRPRKSRDWKDL